MDKVYLICFNQIYNGMDEFGRLLDGLEEIISDWRSDLPNSCYIKSMEDAEIISAKLKEVSPAKGRFFICEITDNCDGFVTQETWPFILEQPVNVTR